MTNDEILWTAPTAISGALYLLMGALFALARIRRAPRDPAATPRPRVSILKPLAGMDEDLAENLESFAHLDWPDQELLLGCASVDDPAWPVARAFLARHPQLRARLVLTDPRAALNPKVAQLIGLSAAATGEVLLISDSNIRVAPDYLRVVVAALRSRNDIGLVTTLVAGTGERSLGAALENLQLGTYIGPAVLAGYTLTGRAISVGKSMALWRHTLAAIGGFRRVGNVLAEDHVLGQAVDRAGFRVHVVSYTVENRNVRCGVRRTVERHARWARMRRTLHPFAYLLEPLLSPLVISTALVLLHPDRETALALGAAAVLQLLAAPLQVRILRGRSLPLWLLPLELVRAYVFFGCWLAGWASRRVVWRGHAFDLRRGSVLQPVSPGSRPGVTQST